MRYFVYSQFSVNNMGDKKLRLFSHGTAYSVGLHALVLAFVLSYTNRFTHKTKERRHAVSLTSYVSVGSHQMYLK